MPYDPTEDIAKYGAAPVKDKPPASTPRKPAAKAPAAARTTTASMNDIRESLESSYVLIGGLLGAYPNPRLNLVGGSIADNAEKCAAAIVEAAEKDPKLKKALIKMMSAGAYTGLIVAHMPILMSIYLAVTLPAAPVEVATPDTSTEESPERPLFRGM